LYWSHCPGRSTLRPVHQPQHFFKERPRSQLLFCRSLGFWTSHARSIQLCGSRCRWIHRQYLSSSRFQRCDPRRSTGNASVRICRGRESVSRICTPDAWARAKSHHVNCPVIPCRYQDVIGSMLNKEDWNEQYRCFHQALAECCASFNWVLNPDGRIFQTSRSAVDGHSDSDRSCNWCTKRQRADSGGPLPER